MLYPIEMTFENAKEFKHQTVFFSDPKKLKGGRRIDPKNYKENVMIGGLNGSGKSTVASVFACVLHSDTNDADPTQLMPTNIRYDKDNPWMFKGRIVFINDGLEDYKQFIELNARFEGVPDKGRPKILSKYFTVRESDTLDGLSTATEYVFSNRRDRHQNLEEYKNYVNSLGISPDKYLLYWRQNEAGKFTLIKDSERFNQAARMMGLDDSIANLDRMMEQKDTKQRDFQTLQTNCALLEIDVKNLEVDKREKETRDEALQENTSAFLGTLSALEAYNAKTTKELKNTLFEKNVLFDEYQSEELKIQDKKKVVVSEQTSVKDLFDKNESEVKDTNTKTNQINQKVEEFTKEVNEGQTQYNQTKEFLDTLKMENLEIEDIEKLIEALQKALAEVSLALETKGDNRIKKEKLIIELEQQIGQLALEKDELANKILFAEQFLMENPVASVLEDEIAGLKRNIVGENTDLQNEKNQKTLLENELKELRVSLDRHMEIVTADIQGREREVLQLNSQVRNSEDELKKFENEKLIVTNELSKESEDQLNQSIESAKAQKGTLLEQESRCISVIEQLSLPIVGLYHSLKKHIKDVSCQIESLLKDINTAETQINMTENTLEDAREKYQKTIENLSKFKQTTEQFEEMIKDSREKETGFTLSIDRSTSRVKQLKEELDRIDQGIVDQTQKKSIEKQQLASYGFQDVFEFTDAELNRDKESILSLLKYTILVEADGENLFPYSSHYHIPLNDYPDDSPVLPLPFGLEIKKEISPSTARKAASWLRNASGFLKENGFIADGIGIRGYDPETVNYCLSRAAREYNKVLLAEKILFEEKAQGEYADQQKIQKEFTLSLEAQRIALNTLLNEKEELEKTLSQLNLNMTHYTGQKRISEEGRDRQIKIKGSLDRLFSVYKNKYDNGKTLPFITLEDILGKEQKYSLDIIRYETAEKELNETTGKLTTLNDQIIRLEARMTAYKEKQERLKKINEEIKEWIELIDQEKEKAEKLSGQLNEIIVLKSTIDQWLTEFNRYFSDQSFFIKIHEEKALTVLELNVLQAKSHNLYSYNMNLRKIITSIEQIEQKITQMSEYQFNRVNVLSKVREAEGVKNRIPEKEKMLTNITDAQKISNEAVIDIKFLDKELEKLAGEKVDTTGKLTLYKGYFAQHQNIDFEFLEHYELIGAKLGNLKEEQRGLLVKYQSLSNRSEELRSQLSEIQSRIDPLTEKIEELNGLMDDMTNQITGFETRLRDFEKDTIISLSDNYGYTQVMEESFSMVTMKDYSSIFRTMYNGKFALAVRDGYMPDINTFVTSLYVEPVEILDDKAYQEKRMQGRQELRSIRTIIAKSIKESATHDYEVLKTEYDKNIRYKDKVGMELEDMQNIVAQHFKTVEGTIISSVRAISEKLNEVLAPMNYVVQLEYKNKEEGGGFRRLQMFFKKSHDPEMRQITENGGLSGGENAVVSLMMTYAILIIKEEKNMEGKIGGYLLLDEWDANLDHLNAQMVFDALKKLDKKIISITPRGRNYSRDFGLILRVINTPKKHGIVIIKEEESEAFFKELEAADSKRIDANRITNTMASW